MTAEEREQIERNFKSIIETMNDRFEFMELKIKELQREIDRLRTRLGDNC
jgi:chaperonin cofactor prefoldin